MKNKIKTFRSHVIESSENPDFIHHEWFVKYHLEILEKIAHEACEKYPDANRDIVDVMVWLHDYGKILDFDRQYELTGTKGRRKLLEIGFDTDFVDRVVEYVEVMDTKEKLELSPIEVQIVSSADGASHLVGPFFSLYWYENTDKPFKELMKNNMRKALIDWEKKVVLPEIRDAFRARHTLVLEQSGKLPESYL